MFSKNTTVFPSIVNVDMESGNDCFSNLEGIKSFSLSYLAA